MLSQADFANASRHIAIHTEAIESNGLRLRVDYDLTNFAAVRGSFPGYVHPTLDPNRSLIVPGTGVWLEATDRDHRVVGCVAMRRFENERLAELIWSRQLWGDRHPILRPIVPITLLWPQDMAEPAGRLVYSGGLYLEKQYTGNRAGIRMVKLLRAIVFRSWRPDWVFGLAAESLARRGVPTEFYGYTRTVRCFDEHVDFGPKHEQEWVSTISQDEMRREYAAEPSVPANRKAPALDQGYGHQAVAAG